MSNFVDRILQISHQVTDPAVPGIDGDYLLADGSTNAGFALLFVPESDLPPHRVLLNISEVKDHYFRRSGSSFIRASHSQLEDMFGRRPRPHLSVEFELNSRSSDNETWLTALLVNNGRGIARYPYLSLEIAKPYGISEYGIDGNGRFGLPVLEKVGGFRRDQYSFLLYTSMKFGSQDGIVIQSGMRHPITQVIRSTTEKNIGETRDLRVTFSVAAGGLTLRTDEITLSMSDISQLPIVAPP